MFRITRKADYAVFLLSTLARTAAEEGRGVLTSAQDLASYSSLNKSLVANLLKDMHRASLVDSVRGARGGYRLARASEDIHLAEILHAVEGPVSFVECATDHALDLATPNGTANGTAAAHLNGHGSDQSNSNGVAEETLKEPLPGACSLTDICTSKGMLRVLHLRIRGLLEDIKLNELAGLKRSTPVADPVADSISERMSPDATRVSE